jgi:excisionase family DNA binding protein
MTYTLGEAAKATGLTKPTLSKAIKSGRISAVRNDNGSYTIDPSELHRVFPPASGNQQNVCNPLRLETPLQLVAMLEKEQEERERERRQQQATIDDLRRRLDASEAAREAATAETRRLTLLLTHQQQPTAETAPPGLWRRLFGG